MAFDPFAEDTNSSGPFDPFAETPAPKGTKQNQGIAGDTLTGLKRGVEQMPGMLTGIADIAAAPFSAATGINRPFSRGADWFGEKTGFQPGKWAEEAGQEYSPELQQQLRNVEEAKGFFPTIGAIAQNPRVAANLVAESLPSTIAGGLVARGAMGAVAGAEKLAALRAAAGSADAAVANAAKAQLLKSGAIAGGIGEGAVTAGQQMAQTDYNVDPLLAGGTALAAGAITGAIGAGSGRLANSAIGKKLGLSDLETSIAAGTLGQNAGKAGALGYAKRIGAGAAQEGLLEEAPQSYQEQVWQNIANGKPWNEGAAEAAAQGAVAGGLMGGGINAIPRATPPQDQAPANPPVVPPANPNVVEVPTATGSVPVDRTAGPISAAVHAGVSSDAIPTAQPVTDTTADPFERLATLELLSEQRVLTPQEEAEANALSAQIDNESVVQNEPQVTATAEPTTATAEQSVADLSGDKLTKEWTAFSDDSGSLGIPRSQMPQIKAEHRGAMTQFMNARGVQHTQEEVAANSLKPTQAEFSPAKVKKAIGFDGGDRSILVSSDNYVLDGHHQWLAKLDQGEPIKVIRLDAPINDLIQLAHDFPSSETAKGASNKAATTAEIQRRATAPAQPTTSPIAQTATQLNVPDAARVAKSSPLAQKTEEANAPQVGIEQGAAQGQGVAGVHSKQASAAPQQEENIRLQKVIASLQNRSHRDSAASAAQMSRIAGNPDPDLLMASPTMGDGAPVVTALHNSASIPEEFLGASGQITTAKRKIPFRYALVEASSLSPSHFADGRRNVEYATDNGKLTTITNGRSAGIIEAYARGTTGKYRAALEQTDASYGFQAGKAAGMKEPVIVRMIQSDQLTDDIGDESNVSGQLGLSATEQARNDAARFDATSVEYTEDGRPTDSSMRGFIAAMPEGERQQLAPDGRPTKQAIDRLNAAVFHSAYEDAELVEMMAQSAEEEVKTLMAALSKTSGAMAKLNEAGDLDIRRLVVGAARKIINASRNGITAAKFIKQGDLLDGSAEQRIAEFIARNIRSAKRMSEALADAAEFAYAESLRSGVDMFGENIPTASRNDVVERITNADLERRNEGLEQPGRRQPDVGDARRKAADQGRPGDAGIAQANEPEAGYNADKILEGYDQQSLNEREQRVRNAERAAKLVQDQLDREEKARLDRLEIARRSKGAASDFELGGDAINNLAGQQSLFSTARKYDTKTLDLFTSQLPARPGEDTAASRSDRIVVAARALVRGSRGSLLGLALNADWIKGKGSSLLGKRVTSAADLATLAAVLRDPKAETMRYFLVKGDQIVYHTAVSSRLAGSSSAFVGDQQQFLNGIKAAMDRLGADGYYLMHNHPSRLVKASDADLNLTAWIANRLPGFKEHIILDHTEFGLIQMAGGGKAKYADYLGARQLAKEGPDPTRNASPEHAALNGRITAFTDFAKYADAVRSNDNVVLVAVDTQLTINGIMEVSKDDMKAGSLTAYKNMVRLKRASGADAMFAVLPPSMKFGDLNKSITNSAWLIDVNHQKQGRGKIIAVSAAQYGQMLGGRGVSSRHDRTGVVDAPRAYYGEADLFADMARAEREEIAAASSKGSPQMDMFAMFDSVQPEAKKSPQKAQQEAQTGAQKETAPQREATPAPEAAKAQNWPGDLFGNEQKQERGEPAEQKPAQEASQKEEAKPVSDAEKSFDFMLKNKSMRTYHELNNERLKGEYRSGYFEGYEGNPFPEGAIKSRAMDDGYLFGRRIGEQDRTGFGKDENGNKIKVTSTVKKTEESGPAAVDAKKEAETDDRVPKQYNTMAAIDSAIEGFYDGSISLDDYKAAFNGLMANKDAILAELGKLTKDQLLRRVGKKMYGGSETKPEIVTRTFDAIREAFALRRSYGRNSWTMGPGQYEKYIADNLAALTSLVEGSTDEDLKAFADEIGKGRASRQEKIDAAQDPKTLEDFENAIRLKKAEGLDFNAARMSLTPEQRAEFDRLRGTQTRDERKARADQQKTEVRVAAQTTGAQIVEGTHSKHGYPIWSVQLADRVDGDSYKTLLSTAKRMGGNYVNQMQARMWKTVWGFQFRDSASAEAFMKLAAGDKADAESAIQERRDAFADDMSQSAVERLNEMADRLDERADESLGRERKSNTERRARFAASAESAANAEKALATTMRRIADAIRNGTAKFLDRVRQKAQVEYLSSVLRSAHDKMLRERYPSYGDYVKHKDSLPTSESADYAEFPQYAMMRSDLASMARQIIMLPGMKSLGQRVLKLADDTSDAYNKFAKDNVLSVSRFGKADGSGLATFSTLKDAERSIEVSGLQAVAVPLQIKRGEYRIVLSPSEAMKRGIWQGDDRKIFISPDDGAEIVEKLGKLNRKAGKRGDMPQAPWQFENAYNDRKRLAGMGIEQPWEFRAMLREFAGLKEAPKELDKIKQMEREMIGRRNDGLDFFPTSPAAVEQMLSAAEIQEGMAILEPSAGMGHIAEAIREAGVEPDVVELSNDRKELLEAKGFNVIGRDFMDINPRKFFMFGDVFKAPDGTTGIMRGASGLGGNRVRLVNSNGDNLGYFDRDELSPVEKRGVESGYDRIFMNPPFSDRRDAEHIQHAYSLLKPGGRLVAIAGEGVFFGQDKKAQEFRDWLEQVGATDEKLPDGSFMDPSLPVNTSTNARMVVIDKPEGAARYSKSDNATQFESFPRAQAESRIKSILGDKLGKVLIDSGIVTLVDNVSQLKNLAGAKFMVAWHGSPHDHDKFDSGKIGTGEGAQAYGYGHYFAGNKEVAEYYRNTLSSWDFGYSSEEAKLKLANATNFADGAWSGLRQSLTRADGDAKKASSMIRSTFYSGVTDPNMRAAYLVMSDMLRDGELIPKKTGATYQVELAPSEDEYLDWDKPLSEQSEIVRKALTDKSHFIGEYLSDALEIANDNGVDFNEYGKSLYKIVSDQYGSDKSASDYLHSIGIRGIRYLDGSSRSKGEGNSNYVIFSDDDVSITAKYAKQDGDIQGATLPDGRIALVLDNLNADNFAGVLQHEGFHSTIRDLVGEQTYTQMMKRLETMLAMGKGAQWVKDADAAIPSDTKAEHRTEEIAAYSIEQYVNGAKQPNIIKRWVESLLSALRTAIIQRMPNGKLKLWAIGNLKPQDLARMAVAGMKAKAQGQLQSQGREAMAYSQSLPATINVDGIDRPTTNSNGKPIHPTEEGIRNFWKWFAGSKVVDAQGRPLVVYHSSLEDIERFNKTGKFMGHTGTSGISVTDNPEMANRYLDRYGTTRYDGKLFDKNMMALYVKAENPLYRDEPFQTNLRLGAPLPSGYVSPAVRLGYDSLIRSDAISRKGIVKHSDAKNAVKGREIVVFSPEQIKSATGNTGAFSPTNPDIRYSRSGNAPAQPANQPQPSGPWQQAKAKFNTLVSPEAIDTLIYNFQDKYIDLKNVIDRIKEMNGTINDLNDARLGEETYHSKVMKKTKDFTNNEIRPLLQQLLNNGIQKEDFEQYLHARHAPEANAVLAERNPNQQMIVAGQQKASADLKSLQSQLSAAQASGSATKSIEDAIEQAKAELAKWSGAQAFQGTEAERNSLSGMSDQDAAQIIAAVPAGKLAAMQSAAAKVDAIQAKTLAELEKMGLMDKASLDAWRATYQNYVPLHRDEAHPDGASHPVGQGFSVKGDASKRRVGSNAKVTNILGHIAMQREAAIVRGEKNSVSKRMYLLAKQNPIRDFWQVDRPPMREDIDPRTGFVRRQVDPTYKNKPNVLMVRIAGKDAAIVFNEHNPEAIRLAGALKNLDGQDLDVVERTIGAATRWIASVNTQYNPIFGLINFARDVQTGVLNLTSTDLKDKKAAVWKETMRLFKEITKAGFNLDNLNATDKALWNDFQDNGGATGYRDMFANPEDRAKALEKELNALGRSNSVKRVFAVADWLSNYNESMENVVRMSAYKVGLQSGMSKERAASLAKNLTVNFNRKGSKAQKLGAFYAFFNASVQGTARMAQTLKGPVGKKIIIGGIALGVMQQMLGMLFMGGGDDDEWDKIPDFVKERSMIFPTGKDTYVSIPMPLGFNALPNIGRLMTEWAVGGQDKPTAKQIGKLFNIMLSSLNPVGGNDLVDVMSPTVSDPVVSLLRNKDWTGKPIYREDTAGLDPTPGFTRTKDTATPWAKGMSYVVNMATGGTNYQPGAVSWTPDQIDYVIGQLTGGAGRELGKFAQTISAPFSGDELPMHKVPLLGRVIGSTAGVSGQSERFYENIKTLNGIEREIKGLAKAGEDVDSYIAGEPKSLLVGLANASESQVKKLREAQRMLKKEGDTAGAKELDVVVAGIMKGLNTEVRAANR